MAETPLVTFDVPGIAADAIRVESALAVARMAAIPNRVFRFYYFNDGTGRRCRITCSRDMAHCLVEAFRLWAVKGGEPSEIVVECATAAAAAVAALEDSARQ